MRRGPEVIVGARSPKEAPEREQVTAGMIDLAIEALENAKAANEAPENVSGKRRFGSLAMSLKLTVKVREEREVNGITIPAIYRIVSFSNGELVVDPKDKDAKLIIEAVEGHRHYGRELYDIDVTTARAERAAAEAFLSHVDKLPPDLQDKLREKLSATQADDFELPSATETPATAEAATA